jgi:hypothetical protein
MDINFKEKSKENKNEIIEKEISPSDRLSFANKVMFGLFLTFLVSTAFISYYANNYGKFVFTSTLQIINTFGSFIMGFYFSRSK